MGEIIKLGGEETGGLTLGGRRIVLRRSEAVGARTFRIDYENELNAAQLEAVLHTEGPALVIAGAGTGKTRTLTYRVARLVESGIDPESILLLTFTRRASNEMLRRAAGLLHDQQAERVSGGTFHSFANVILRKYAKLIGFESGFSILDQGDSEDVINLIRQQMGLASQRRRFPRKHTLAAMISLSTNRQLPIDEVILKDYPSFSNDLDQIVALASHYDAYKRRSNVMDYDDLLVNLGKLLERQPDVRREVHRKYRYVMVDEYQDVNRLQATLVQKISGEDPAKANVMVVGDDAQSIYRFRGAEVENIFEFPELFPGAVQIRLEENFRSIMPILDLTNEIISRSPRRYDKTLYSRLTGEELPKIVCAESEHDQSIFVVDLILQLRESGTSLDEIAILFRSGYMSFDLELELQRANIPFQKFGGMKFVETAHIKDLVAMLRILANVKDVVSWYRVLLLLDGVGPKTAERIVDDITSGAISFRRVVTDGETIHVPHELSSAPKAVLELMGALKEASNEGMGPADRLDILMRFYKPLLKKKYDDHQKRLKDLETFSQIAERYRSLQSFLTDLSLEPPTQSLSEMEAGTKEDEKLTLSTIHSAKGLEWNTVIITNCLEGRFPSSHSAGDQDALEEERRLMYVAATRAKEHLVITYPTNLYDRESGIVLSRLSQFVDGLPEGVADSFVLAIE